MRGEIPGWSSSLPITVGPCLLLCFWTPFSHQNFLDVLVYTIFTFFRWYMRIVLVCFFFFSFLCGSQLFFPFAGPESASFWTARWPILFADGTLGLIASIFYRHITSLPMHPFFILFSLRYFFFTNTGGRILASELDQSVCGCAECNSGNRPHPFSVPL